MKTNRNASTAAKKAWVTRRKKAAQEFINPCLIDCREVYQRYFWGADQDDKQAVGTFNELKKNGVAATAAFPDNEKMRSLYERFLEEAKDLKAVDFPPAPLSLWENDVSAKDSEWENWWSEYHFSIFAFNKYTPDEVYIHEKNKQELYRRWLRDHNFDGPWTK